MWYFLANRILRVLFSVEEVLIKWLHYVSISINKSEVTRDENSVCWQR